MLEVLPPFSHVQVEFMLNLLNRWVENEERTAFIIRRLTDPQGPDYASNRSDLHYMEGLTVYAGQSPS